MRWKRKSDTPEVMRFKGAAFSIPLALPLHGSFFVPCLKPKETYDMVLVHYRTHHYSLVWEERVEEGVLGIRVWRAA